MCGIVGVASKYKQEDKHWLKIASESLIHRGPDSFGEWWSSNFKVGFAHRRLSIQDISSAGNQPMRFEERKITIIFNGEIYNFKEIRKELINFGHKFKSKTDTEVLLAAYSTWGKNMVKKLNGMFAFAIYDEIQNIIFLARDRAGEKPLYFNYENNTIFFASELKALFKNQKLIKEIDYNFLDTYLNLGFVPGTNTLIKNFKKLPAGKTLTFSITHGSILIESYWELPEPKYLNQSHFNSEDYLSNIEQLLFNSISKQLIADVPVGILLSGGLDSSLITAIAVKCRQNIKTFNVTFPNNKNFNESNHAKLIANHFKTEHIELEVNSASANLLPKLAKQFDEPIVDSSIIPTSLLTNTVRDQCKVALGGDGADELFGGYDHYQRILLLEKYFSKLPQFIISGLTKLSDKYINQFRKSKNYFNALGMDFNNDVPLLAQYFDKKNREKIFNNDSYIFESEKCRKFLVSNEKNLLDRYLRFDFNGYLNEDILVKVDRSSMLNSLEIRAPFLDYKLIEYTFKFIPPHLKATHKNKKILLKKLGYKLLPKSFNFRRKQGFCIPLNEWLQKGDFKDLFWDTLRSNDCIFNKLFINEILEKQEKYGYLGEKLFALVFFELWRKSYKI